MKKNDDRKLAESAFLSDRGRITNKELAHRLGVHPATVARWKKLDEWDIKLVQSVGAGGDLDPADEDSYTTDLRHLALLNEKLENHLQKDDLLTSEVLELAEAKYHIMSCMEVINDRFRLPLSDEFGDEDID